MNNQWYTVAEIEQKTGIPHQTIRRYIKNHSHHLIMKKQHKSYLINEQSIKVIEQVRNWYSDGMNSEQVDEALATSGIPMNITIESEQSDENPVSINLAEGLINIEKQVSELTNLLNKQIEANEDQKDFNKALLKKLDEQNDYIKNWTKQRDEQLIMAIRESQEVKKMLVASAEQEKKDSIWTRWFRKK